MPCPFEILAETLIYTRLYLGHFRVAWSHDATGGATVPLGPKICHALSAQKSPKDHLDLWMCRKNIACTQDVIQHIHNHAGVNPSHPEAPAMTRLHSAGGDSLKSSNHFSIRVLQFKHLNFTEFYESSHQTHQ
jgi:hypothetical protein